MFRSHIANLYAGHQSGAFLPDQQSRFHGTHRKKSMATHSSAKKHTVTMQLKSHMVGATVDYVNILKQV